MEILKAKKFNLKDNYAKGLSLVLLNAHKFEINVEEVFGEDFTILGPQTHLNKMPSELMPFLNLPHESVYMEFSKSPVRLDKGSFGLLAWNTPKGIIRIVPVMTLKGVVSFVDVQFDLGVKRPLEAIDFDTPGAHKQWLREKTNISNRFAIYDLSDGFLGNREIDFLATSITMLLESLMYINAKGVGSTTNHPTIKKHIKRKSPLKDFTYKTLRIIKKGDPENIHHYGMGKIPFITRQAREHTVRGHIAIYTSENPLFGNPKNVGPIWVSPHVRNRGTAGKIVKNYEIV